MNRSSVQAGPSGVLVEGRDYMVDRLGRYVFTAGYLLSRGNCCGSGCRNCPYAGPKQMPVKSDASYRTTGDE